MRDNDLLDGAWDAPEEQKPAPKVWKRSSCRDLDLLFGVEGEYEPPTIVTTPMPVTRERATRVTTRTTTRKKVRRRKATKVKPEDAVRLLAIWEKKLLLARRKVQKYRQAVKRYQKKGMV
jgi:hypothetical protein